MTPASTLIYYSCSIYTRVVAKSSILLEDLGTAVHCSVKRPMASNDVMILLYVQFGARSSNNTSGERLRQFQVCAPTLRSKQLSAVQFGWVSFICLVQLARKRDGMNAVISRQRQGNGVEVEKESHTPRDAGC
jgi:hypothetical protein